MPTDERRREPERERRRPERPQPAAPREPPDASRTRGRRRGVVLDLTVIEDVDRHYDPCPADDVEVVDERRQLLVGELVAEVLGHDARLIARQRSPRSDRRSTRAPARRSTRAPHYRGSDRPRPWHRRPRGCGRPHSRRWRRPACPRWRRPPRRRPSALQPLRVGRRREDDGSRAHRRMAEPAQLRTDDREPTELRRRDDDLLHGPRHDVLLDAPLRHPERVDDVDRQSSAARSSCPARRTARRS